MQVIPPPRRSSTGINRVDGGGLCFCRCSRHQSPPAAKVQFSVLFALPPCRVPVHRRHHSSLIKLHSLPPVVVPSKTIFKTKTQPSVVFFFSPITSPHTDTRASYHTRLPHLSLPASSRLSRQSRQSGSYTCASLTCTFCALARLPIGADRRHPDNDMWKSSRFLQETRYVGGGVIGVSTRGLLKSGRQAESAAAL